MTQAPRRFIVHRQAAKPKQSRSYTQKKLSVKDKVSREATACPGKYKATLSLLVIAYHQLCYQRSPRPASAQF
jgi:hypothetical protein